MRHPVGDIVHPSSPPDNWLVGVGECTTTSRSNKNKLSINSARDRKKERTGGRWREAKRGEISGGKICVKMIKILTYLLTDGHRNSYDV